MVDAPDWAPSDSLPALLVWGPQMPALPKFSNRLHSAERADSSKNQLAKPNATPTAGPSGRAMGIGSRRACGAVTATSKRLSRRRADTEPWHAPWLLGPPSGVFWPNRRPSLTTAGRVMAHSQAGFLRNICEFLEPDLRTATRPQRQFGHIGQPPAGQGIHCMPPRYRQPKSFPSRPAASHSMPSHALPQAKRGAPHAA